MSANRRTTSLAAQVVRSFLYSGVGNTLSKVINVVALLVVLKLISPEAFGQASIVLAIFAVVHAVTELGLGVAIVQAGEMTKRQLDSLFWVSLLLTGALFVLIVVAAPVASTFFRQPGLTPLLRVYALAVLLYTFCFVSRNLLVRDLSFGSLAIADNAALLASSIIMVVLAFAGYGAWSIILAELSARVGQLFLYQVLRPFWPGLHFDWAAIREHVRFGVYATGSRLLYNLYTNADYFIVGRFFDAHTLGVYTLAYRLVSDTVRTLTSAINQVAYPAFARLQEELPRLRRYFFTIARANLLLVGLVLVVIGTYTDEVLKLGGYDEWLASVPLIRIFAGIAVLRAVAPLVPQLLNAVGEARLNFYYSLSNAVVMPIAFFIGAQYGLLGVGWAWVVAYPLVVCLLFIFGARVLRVPFGFFVVRTFSRLWLLLLLLTLALVLRSGLAGFATPTLNLAIGIIVTLAGGLGAIYLLERDTLAVPLGRSTDVK